MNNEIEIPQYTNLPITNFYLQRLKRINEKQKKNYYFPMMSILLLDEPTYWNVSIDYSKGQIKEIPEATNLTQTTALVIDRVSLTSYSQCFGYHIICQDGKDRIIDPNKSRSIFIPHETKFESFKVLTKNTNSIGLKRLETYIQQFQ